MTLKISRFIRSLPLSGHIPSKRALAAIAKLNGRRLEKRWPFLPKSEGRGLNLGFEDLLEFQYARSRHFFIISVGAYDGLENDPISRFIRSHDCHGILLEPQPGAFKRLCNNYKDFPNFELLNAAVDQVSGFREIYYVPAGIEELPAWAEQLASFHIEHLLKHVEKAPDLAKHIRQQIIQTISFEDLLGQSATDAIDVLQIDAEGMDAQLLIWFPFERIRPSVLHYETAHMSPAELLEVRARLQGFGYIVYEADAPTDDMAVLI